MKQTNQIKKRNINLSNKNQNTALKTTKTNSFKTLQIHNPKPIQNGTKTTTNKQTKAN